MKRSLIYVSFTLLLLFFGSGQTQALTTIDTTPAWLGSWIGFFGYPVPGYPDTATVGQIITVPTKDKVLTSFSFYMQLPTTCTFRGFVYAWDGTKATGPALYESSTVSTSYSNFEEITFYPAGLELTPGAQ